MMLNTVAEYRQIFYKHLHNRQIGGWIFIHSSVFLNKVNGK